uniref:Uncharacterized protein n=1 Tax=Rhizophora mucronata TaxID=61149 RepID=A0A2P2PWY0_RHIMU
MSDCIKPSIHKIPNSLSQIMKSYY